MQKVFLDDKFDVVVDELISSRGGWERVNDQSSSNLVWTNLRSVLWDDLMTTEETMHQVVNHLKGSQHLSNKSFI